MADNGDGRVGNLIPTVLSLVSALGVAYLTYMSTTVKTDSDTVLRNREINLEQTKCDAAERERYDQNVVKIIAQVLGKTEQERATGIATLRTLYPERAEQVLQTIASTVEEPRTKATLEAEAKSAQRLAVDSWVVVAGADASLADAQVERTRASGAGLTANIYHRAGSFRTVVGPFPTRADADRANIAVRGVLRNDAYPARLTTWCPASKQDASGYFECPSS